MKKLITKLQLLKFSLITFVLCTGSITAFGQASPWCDGSHRYQSGYSTTGYLVAMEQVRISSGGTVLNNKSADGFNATTGTCGSEYRFVLPVSKAIDITAGNSYTIEVSASSSYGYTLAQVGAFIDFNKDKDFTDAGEFLGTWTAPISGTNTPGSLSGKTFNIPCNISPGASRLRVVMNYQYENVNSGQGCSTCSGGPANYGETEDYSINLVLPTSVSANFVAPSSAFIRTSVKFINANQKGYTEHAWDANNDGTWEQRGVTADYSTNPNTHWTTPGTKSVKLRSTNCLGRDSVVKTLTLVAPTVVPTADFISSKTNVEIYDQIQLFDLSSDGPYMWSWNVYDSTTYANDPFNPVSDYNNGWLSYDNGTNANSKNPYITFYRDGVYCVELIATNGIGPSVMKKKCFYVTVVQPTNYYLGFGSYGPNSDNIVGSATGTIIDDGGINGKYSNDQGYGTRSYLQITPCNALKIKLNMTQLRFASIADYLSVYDGKNDKGTLLGRWTQGDKAPKTVTATSGSMFILFISDGGGQDSGYLGTYTSELGAKTPPNPDFMPSTDPGYNGTPIKFINTTTNISGVPTWEWTVDGSQIGTKKDATTRFYTDGTYEVCLEIKSCVGNKKTCQFLDIITPNVQSKVDFVADNRRPTVGVDKSTLKPLVDNANRFSWTIFPTTYTLMNPPALPSKYGSGFINYMDNPGDSFPTPILKFTASGCYTITLRAWNDLDSNATVKTVVKNKYVCALDYCVPNSYILSADVAINRVRVLDGSNVLINNPTASGVAAYTDYTSTSQAVLTFGRTYQVEVSRNSTVDPANRVGWIDWNIDGDFSDAGEKIFVEPSSQDASYTASFTVPPFASSFEGLTKMRIAANYDNYPTTECGPVQAGEYEDYGLILANDNQIPVITLNGSDTVRIEKCFPYIDAGAVAIDASEGDISSRMVITSDLDSCTTGIYTIEYNVTDASGNPALTKRRTIIVVLDKTPPVLVLNPGGTGCIEARRDNPPYVDPGATAIDPKNLTNLTSAIVVTGEVNTRKVGTYILTYTVQDIAANVTTQTRTVCVADTKGPVINPLGPDNIQIGTLWNDQTTVEDAYDTKPVMTDNWGTNGKVNPLVRASYPVTYTAVDEYGNPATPVSRTYRVDDFIPPVISLNTLPTVYHEVRTKYISVQPDVVDNYYSSTEVSLTMISSNVLENTLGTYTEVFEAVDGSLNVTTKTRTVIVVDTKAPTIWGETIHACVGTQCNPMWGLSTTDNYNSPAQLKPFIEIINQDVDPTNAGIYTITYKVTDLSNNVSDPFTRLVVYTYWPNCRDNSVGIDKVPGVEESVNLYPNPSTGVVTLDLQGAIAKNATVNVYNAMGQVVFTKLYNEAIGKYEIDLSDVSTGVYTVRLVADGVTVTKRVTIAR